MIIPTDLIHVCALPTPRDLEFACLLGWYRTPLRTAPKVVAVDALAFCQLGLFSESGEQIETTARVRGHELTARGELLRDEPDHPRVHEEYYKTQLGPLEKLPGPITADKWRRSMFLCPAGECLLMARKFNDPVVQREEQQLLWHPLRERAAQEQTYTTGLPEADIPPELLIALLGIKEPEEGKR